MRIIVDLDGVLCDIATPISAALRRRLGKDIPWRRWTQYSILNIYNIPIYKLHSIMQEECVLERAKPYKGARKFLDELRERNHIVLIMTCRGWHPNSTDITRAWMAHHKLVADGKIVLDYHQRKADVIRGFDSTIGLFIDDNPSEIKAARKLNNLKEAQLFARPWNQAHDPRVHSYEQVLRGLQPKTTEGRAPLSDGVGALSHYKEKTLSRVSKSFARLVKRIFDNTASVNYEITTSATGYNRCDYYCRSKCGARVWADKEHDSRGARRGAQTTKHRCTRHMLHARRSGEVGSSYSGTGGEDRPLVRGPIPSTAVGAGAGVAKE